MKVKGFERPGLSFVPKQKEPEPVKLIKLLSLAGMYRNYGLLREDDGDYFDAFLVVCADARAAYRKYDESLGRSYTMQPRLPRWKYYREQAKRRERNARYANEVAGDWTDLINGL